MSPTTIGPAAPGWPTSGGVVDGDRLHLVSRNLDRTRIAEVDLDTGALVRQVEIGRGDGAWGLVTAPDGVYVGLFGARGQGNLLRLVAGRATGVAALDADYVWDLAVTAGGTVIAVTGQPSLVVAYEPATGRARDLGLLSGGQQPRTCAIAGGRLVLGGHVRGRAFLVDAPTGGGPTRSLLPAALAADDTVYCSAAGPDGRIAVGTSGPRLDRPAIAVVDPSGATAAVVIRLPREATVDTVTWAGGAVHATARPSGALYRLDVAPRRLTRVAVPVPMSETRLLAPVGDRLVAVSADGTVIAHDRPSGRTTTTSPAQLGLLDRPQRAQSICASAQHVDVGGSFSLTRHRTGAQEPPDQRMTTRFVPGEPKAMVDVQDTLYLALYPIAEVWCWPPDDDRPRRLTQLDSDQRRPIGMAWQPQLGALLVTTTDDRTRSVLHTVDPVTGRVDTLVDPLGSQALAGVAALGTTTVVGGSGADPSVAAYDAVTGARLWRTDGVAPDGGFVLGVQPVAGRLVISTSRGWVTTLDPTTGAARPPVRAAPLAGQLRRVGDRVLLATGDRVLRIDPATLRTEVVADDLDGQFWGWPPMDVDPAGRALVVAGRDLVRT